MNFTLTEVFMYYVLICGSVFTIAKKHLVNYYSIKGFNVFNFLTLAILISSIEEFFTAGTDFPNRLLVTLPVFIVMFLCVYYLHHFFALSLRVLLILFSVAGYCNEFLIVGRIFEYPILTTIVMTPLTLLIYAVTAYLPLYVLITIKQKS
jgi:hypothetical protein